MDLKDLHQHGIILPVWKISDFDFVALPERMISRIGEHGFHGLPLLIGIGDIVFFRIAVLCVHISGLTAPFMQHTPGNGRVRFYAFLFGLFRNGKGPDSAGGNAASMMMKMVSNIF